jgi:hypothetical protein
LKAWALVIVTMTIEPLTRLIFCAFYRDWKGMLNTLQGYRLIWRNLPRVVFGDSQEGVG